jgi:uracil-DNA glycosylase
VRALLALGAYGWDAALRAMAANGAYPATPTKPRFGHGAVVEVGQYRLVGTYHPSQQNTFTGKLTPAMVDAVIATAKELALS